MVVASMVVVVVGLSIVYAEAALFNSSSPSATHSGVYMLFCKQTAPNPQQPPVRPGEAGLVTRGNQSTSGSA